MGSGVTKLSIFGALQASAKAISRLGDPDRAIELAGEAVEMAESTDSPICRVRR